MLAELLVWSGFFYAFLALPLQISASTGWSLSHIMGAYSTALVALAVVTPLAGRLVDAGWAPIALPVAAAVGAIALGVVATMPSLPVFYLLWAFVGLAMGLTLYEPVFAMLTRAWGDRARGGITAIAIAAGAASLVTFPTAHWLSQSFGWPWALWIFAGMILCLAAPLLRFAAGRLEREAMAQEKPAQRGGPSFQTLFQDRRFRALMLIFLLPALASGLILSQILPVFDRLGVTSGLAIAAAALIGPMQIAARLMTQAIARSAPARRVVVFACLCLSVSAVALALAGHLLLALFLFVIAFGAGNGLVGIFRPLVIREVLGGDSIGAKTGAIAMPALLAVAAAPILGARILETADVTTFLVIAGAVPLLAAISLANLPGKGDPKV